MAKLSERITKAEEKAQVEAMLEAERKAKADLAFRKAERHIMTLMGTIKAMDGIGSKASSVTAKTLVEELKFLRDDDEAYRDAMAKIMVDSIENGRGGGGGEMAAGESLAVMKARHERERERARERG